MTTYDSLIHLIGKLAGRRHDDRPSWKYSMGQIAAMPGNNIVCFWIIYTHTTFKELKIETQKPAALKCSPFVVLLTFLSRLQILSMFRSLSLCKNKNSEETDCLVGGFFKHWSVFRFLTVKVSTFHIIIDLRWKQVKNMQFYPSVQPTIHHPSILSAKHLCIFIKAFLLHSEWYH